MTVAAKYEELKLKKHHFVDPGSSELSHSLRVNNILYFFTVSTAQTEGAALSSKTKQLSLAVLAA